MDSDSINIILWWTALVLGILVFICFKYISWQRQTGRTAITKLLEEYFKGDMHADQLGQRAREIADSHFLRSAELNPLVAATFLSAVDSQLARSQAISEKTLLALLTDLKKEFALSDAEFKDSVEKMGCREISQLFRAYMHSTTTAENLVQLAREIADRHFVSNAVLHALAISGFQNAVDEMVEHHVPSEEEERRLSALLATSKKELGVTDAEVASSFLQLAKANILRNLDAGVITPFPAEDLSIVLLKGEVVLWKFNGVDLQQLKSHTSYVGSSGGVSVRIARGVYVRSGSFKGHRVQTESLEAQDAGLLVVTNQNVYFSGTKKSFRIHLKKIVSVHAYSDGIALVQESTNPKPLVFILDDPWFATNLILKLGATSQGQTATKEKQR